MGWFFTRKYGGNSFSFPRFLQRQFRTKVERERAQPTMLRGYSAIDAGNASTVAAATMTNNEDGSDRVSNDKASDQVSTLPKKKSVRWGEITEHPAETPFVAKPGSHRVDMTESHPNALFQQQQRQQRQQRQQQQQQNMNRNLLPKDGKELWGNRSKCKLPGHSHIWKECPNNPYSRNFCGIDHRTMNFSSHMQPSSLASSGGNLAGSAASQRSSAAAAMKVGATDAAPRFLTNDSERPPSSSSVIPKTRKLPPVVLPSSSKKIRPVS